VLVICQALDILLVAGVLAEVAPAWFRAYLLQPQGKALLVKVTQAVMVKLRRGYPAAVEVAQAQLGHCIPAQLLAMGALVLLLLFPALLPLMLAAVAAVLLIVQPLEQVVLEVEGRAVLQMLALTAHPIQAEVVALRQGITALQLLAVLALSSFAIPSHTLMQLHTHQPLKQQQTGIRFIPSLPLEQSPSKE
jgi:hypothetical protein